MPSPSSSLATLRPDLAGSMEEFDLQADRAGFIGTRLFPAIEVATPSGTFGKIPIEQLLQKTGDIKRASRAGYARGDWTFAPASYSTEEYGWEEPVDDKEAKMYGNYFSAEQVSAQRAIDVVLRAAELRLATMVFNATTWTGSDLTTGVTNEWDVNHTTNAIPIADVNAARNKVWALTGVWPNAIVMNRKVFNNLRALDDIKNAIASSGAGFPARQADITAAQLAAVFDLKYILIAGGSQNTADLGQTASISTIWSDEYAMICRVAETNDPREACIGRVFKWTADSDFPYTIETYRDETTRADIVRVRHDVDEMVMYTELGHLLSNITTI